MKEYNVIKTVTFTVSQMVQADSEEGALQKANNEVNEMCFDGSEIEDMYIKTYNGERANLRGCDVDVDWGEAKEKGC